MSVNKVDRSTGELTLIAGKNVSTMVPSAGWMQSGSKTSDTTEWAVGESGTFTVVFDTPMPDNNYEVFVTTDTPRIGTSVHSKTATDFKVTVMNVSNGAWGAAIKLTWTAVRLMTDQTTALDEEAITKRIAFPDYAHPLTMTSKTWTATQDVFISAFQMTGTSDVQVVTINGERCAADPDSANNVYTYACNAFAKKGDVISYALLDSPYRCKVFPLLT